MASRQNATDRAAEGREAPKDAEIQGTDFDAEPQGDADAHGGFVSGKGDFQPTEEHYEAARTVGIGNEPELPPGVVGK